MRKPNRLHPGGVPDGVAGTRLGPLRSPPILGFAIRWYRCAQPPANRYQASGLNQRSDGGPWYIPVKDEYPNGGYEVNVAFCEPGIDDVLTEGMKRILS